MIVIWLPLLVCLVGLLMYLLASPQHPKVATIGLHMFWVGLFVTLLALPGHGLAIKS